MAASAPPAIEVDGLTKRFGSLLAVDGVRFDVPRGALFGFLGPNGSGKTTTLGMLTGLVPPDAGTARVLGRDVREDLPGALAQVGALVEEPAFYPYLSGRDNLRVLARLAGRDDAAADAALARVGLADAARARYRGYSQGMRRRLGLAAALLADPPVLVLDEPTNGLDPAGQREVRDLLRSFAAAGRTVLVSSHLLHEVQEVCTHVAILRRGRVLAQGPMETILRAESEVALVVDDAARACEVLRGLPAVRAVRAEGDRVLASAPESAAADLNRALVQAGVAVRGLSASRPLLEERFLELTREADA